MMNKVLHVFICIAILALGNGLVWSDEGEGKFHQQSHSVVNKWAVVIGVDDYKSEDIPDLKGAANDAKLMASLLREKYAFPEDNVFTLINEAATRDAIFAALEDSVLAQIPKDAVVVIHYSGHGSQQPDISGDESDRLDETLVPYDGRTDEVKDIVDDELHELLKRLGQKTKHVTFILDSCFSGDGVRASGRIRYLPPAGVSLDSVSTGVDESALDANPADNSLNEYVLLSSARHNQFAYEYESDENLYFGAFTYFLHAFLANARKAVTYRDVIQYVTNQVNTYADTQNPEIEAANPDRYVFSDSSTVTEPHVVVYPTEDESGLVLEAGAVQGMTEGSLFEIYPPGTVSFPLGAPSLGTVEIKQVEAVRSYGTLVSGQEIPPASRAVERAHYFSDRQVVVSFDLAERSNVLRLLKQRMDSLSHVTTTNDSDDFTLGVAEADRRIVVRHADSSLAFVSERFSSVSDSLLMKTGDAIERWARWYNIARLENQTTALALDIKLQRINEALRDSSRTIFAEGDTLEITVTNDSEIPLYFALVELLDSGLIRKRYPATNDGELLLNGARKTIQFGGLSTRGEKERFVIVKVFGTVEPINLDVLEQKPILTRSGGQLKDANPLEQLLAQASSGVYRSMKIVQVDAWGVAQQRFIVRE